MKIVSDEDMIWDELIERLNALGPQYGCEFASFPHRYRNRSIGDTDVPEICSSEGAAALLTANYKDFARHLIYYQALVSAGVSVVVLRQPNQNTTDADVDYQVGLLRPRLRTIVRRLEQTDEPLLFMVRKSGLSVKGLQDLIDNRSA